jgi:hypothetical protein
MASQTCVTRRKLSDRQKAQRNQVSLFTEEEAAACFHLHLSDASLRKVHAILHKVEFGDYSAELACQRERSPDSKHS